MTNPETLSAKTEVTVAKRALKPDSTTGREIKRIVIHCSATVVGEVESIRRYHVNVNKWDDIGYHYVILNGSRDSSQYLATDDGCVEMGRPIWLAGAHCPEANKDSIGICLIGVDKFTVAQMKSLRYLVREFMREYDLGVADVYGHYQFESARKQGKQCPGFKMEDFRALITNY